MRREKKKREKKKTKRRLIIVSIYVNFFNIISFFERQLDKHHFNIVGVNFKIFKK